MISISVSAKTFSCAESVQIQQQTCDSSTSNDEIQKIVKALIYSDNEMLEEISGENII